MTYDVMLHTDSTHNSLVSQKAVDTSFERCEITKHNCNRDNVSW